MRVASILSSISQQGSELAHFPNFRIIPLKYPNHIRVSHAPGRNPCGVTWKIYIRKNTKRTPQSNSHNDKAVSRIGLVQLLNFAKRPLHVAGILCYPSLDLLVPFRWTPSGKIRSFVNTALKSILLSICNQFHFFIFISYDWNRSNKNVIISCKCVCVCRPWCSIFLGTTELNALTVKIFCLVLTYSKGCLRV